jgi:hypothetical protein
MKQLNRRDTKEVFFDLVEKTTVEEGYTTAAEVTAAA